MQNLEMEELDRHLIEEHERKPASPFFGEITKIKVRVKTLTFYNSFRDSITFTRRPDGITFTTRKTVTETKYCSLGHKHEVNDVEEFQFFAIDYEMIQQLKDWAEQGKWIAPSRRKGPLKT